MLFPIEIQRGQWTDHSYEVFQSFPELFLPQEARTSERAGVCTGSFLEEFLELRLSNHEGLDI
jgi:hypothetical protein